MELEIFNQTEEEIKELETVRKVLEYACSKEKLGKVCFNVIIVDNDYIHELNKNYRNIDRVTDVITFALFADDENSIVIDKTIELGEIIISVDTLVKQAQENNNDVKTELYTLVTHGILHLLGFDHQTQKDYDFVVGIQEAVIKNLWKNFNPEVLPKAHFLL